MMGIADQDDTTSGKVRKLWLFDSFRGLPPPSNKDGKQARETYFQGWCQGEPEKVEANFPADFDSRYSMSTLSPGGLMKHLQTADLQTIAILHIDADWYASVKIVLETCI